MAQARDLAIDVRTSAVEAAAAFAEGLQTVANAFKDFSVAVVHTASISLSFTKGVSVAHYNVLGEYTFPIQSELLGQSPTNPADFNLLGRAVLTVPIPVVPISILASITFIPLIGNSFQSFLRAYVDTTNLALWDWDAEDKLQKPHIVGVKGKDKRNWLRKIYGAPGYLLGLIAALPNILVITLVRSIFNSFSTTKLAFLTVINLVSIKTLSALENLSLDKGDNAWYRNGVLGLPGFILGAVLGIVVLPGLLFLKTIGCSLQNLILTATRMTRWIYQLDQDHLTTAEDTEAQDATAKNNKRTFKMTALIFLHKYLLGLPGLFAGLVVGAVAGLAVLARHFIVNSLITGLRFFKKVANVAMHADDQLTIEKDEREKYVRRYFFGGPGIVIGTFAGLLSWPFIIAGRFLLNSAMSGVIFFAKTVNLVLPESNQMDIVKQDDDRKNFPKYFLGFPGIVIGITAGFLAWPFILSIRLLTNSLKKLGETVFSMAKWTQRLDTDETYERLVTISDEEADEDADADEEKSETATTITAGGLLKSGLGLPGVVCGVLLGLPVSGMIMLKHFIVNSFITGHLFFSKVANILLHENNQLTVPTEERIKGSRIYFFGGLGAVFGVAAGLLAWGFILPGRVITNSCKSMSEIVASMAKWTWYLAVNKAPAPAVAGVTTTPDDKRSNWLRYGLGLPGVLLGAVIGLAVSTVIVLRHFIVNSGKTMSEVVKSMARWTLNLDVDNPAAAGAAKVRSPWLRYGFGLLGILPGVLIGAVVSAAIMFKHFIVNSFISGKIYFAKTANLALHNDNPIPQFLISTADARTKPSRIYLFGGLGIGIGVALGVLSWMGILPGRIVTNSYKSMCEIVKSMVKWTWYLAVDKPLAPVITAAAGATTTQNDKRSNRLRYGLGFPGVLLGAVIGLAVSTVIVFRHFIVNSGKTMSEVVKSMARWTLNLDVDNPAAAGAAKVRSPWLRYGFGLLGILPGVLIGAVVSAAIMFKHFIVNSFISGKIYFAKTANLVLHEDNKIPKHLISTTDARTKPSRIYLFGGLGIGVGIALGVLSWLFILPGRMLTNSCKSMYEIVKSMAKWTWYLAVDKPPVPATTPDDKRSNWLRYGLGFPGVLLGAVIGLAVSTMIVFGHFLANSGESMSEVVKSMMGWTLNLDVDNPAVVRAAKARSPWLRYGFGLLGILSGVLFGAIFSAAVMFKHFIVNSFISGKIYFAKTANLVLHEENKIPKRLISTTDARTKLSRIYLFGGLGIGMGVAVGVLSWLFILPGRMLTNSCKSMYEIVKSMAKWTWYLAVDKPVIPPPAAGVTTTQDDDRSNRLRYGLGLPGVLLGAVMGLAVSAVIVFRHFIVNSVATTIRFACTTANIALPADKQIKMKSDGRGALSKYFFGAIGLVLGPLLGLATWPFIITIRMLNQSFESWKALSGTLINIGLNRPIFGGVAEDERGAKAKLLGSFGYGLALVTTLPLAASVFLLRQSLLVFALMMGVAVSPLVVTGKVIAKLVSGPRFPQQDMPYLGALKDLFSALNTWGRWNVGASILTNQDGKKSPWLVLRKCFTFNSKAPTERILEMLLDQYQTMSLLTETSSIDANWLRDKLTTIEDEVNNFYGESCLSNPYAVKQRKQEIRNICDFIYGYLVKHKTSVVPDDIYSKGALFMMWKREGVTSKVPSLSEQTSTAALLAGLEESDNEENDHSSENDHSGDERIPVALAFT